MRNVTEADLPKLVEIELLTQTTPWTVDIFKRCIETGYSCWCIEEDHTVIGFIMMSATLTGEGHILNLCVTPDHQHKGHGRALLSYALSRAKQKGMGIVFLEVRRSNRHAIMLYQKMGFTQISERKAYYPTGQGREDALIFAKDLGIG